MKKTMISRRNFVKVTAAMTAVTVAASTLLCKGPRTNLHRMTDGGELHFCENVTTPKVFVQWGSGLEVSNYDDAGRVAIDNAHAVATYINVDARMSNMAKEADYFLNVRPGTDAAIALAWLKIISDEDLMDDLYVRRWTNAAFLVAPDAPRTQWMRDVPQFEMGMGGSQPVDTILLTEDQVKEGGSPYRFMAWDELAGRLTWLDSETGLWEGEGFKPKYVEGSEDYLKNADIWEKFDWEKAKGKYADDSTLRVGMTPLFVPEPSQFDNIYPALWGEFEVELLGDQKVKVQPVWQYFYENTLSQWTPEAAEEMTGVKADLIEQSCLAYATRLDPQSGYGNGAVVYAVTHEHTGNAMRVLHALQAIDVVLGNTDIPAGHRGPSRPASILPDQSYALVGPSFSAGGIGPSMEAVMKQITAGFPITGSADATAIYDAMRFGEPYPIKGGIADAGGILNQTNITEAWEGLGTLDFFLDLNLWHDPASDLADVLLPMAHWLEVECPRTSQGAGGYYGALIQCKELPGECRWDIDATVDLYKAAGTPYWVPEMFPEAPDMWAGGDYMRGVVIACTGMTWDEYKAEFAEKGWFDNRLTNRNGFGTAKRYETGWFRQPFDGTPGFITPSTRNEIWVLGLESQLHDTDGLQWALPTYVEPKSSPFSTWREEAAKDESNPNREKYAEYTPENSPYTLSTGRRIPVYFHNEHRQLPWCREVWPVPRLEVNPKEAGDLGLVHGDWVWIETPFGKIRQCVDVNACVAEGCMNAEHSWWFPEITRPGRGFDLCGCNCLVDSHAQCEAMGSPQMRGYLVKVYKATPENSPFGNPVPCDDDGTEIITSASDLRLKGWAPDYGSRVVD
jgi:anaerobic selenocysteine-containing dehydrogenase